MHYTVKPLGDYTIFTTPEAKRRTSPFRAGWQTTLNELGRELELLHATDMLLELDVAHAGIRRDGMLRADARVGHHGVRVSFLTRDHGALSYTCDTYDRAYGKLRPWQANVRAVALTLERLRDIDRYGATQGEQYVGFKAIEAADPGRMTRSDAITHLAEMYGIAIEHFPVDASSLRSSWKRAQRLAHPDLHGGDRATWDLVDEIGRALGFDR